MARSARRLTRKEIRQPDQFITLSRQLFDFFTEYKTDCIAAGVALAVIFFAVWGWGLYKSRQNRLAAQEFSTALALYHAGKQREALESLTRVAAYGDPAYNRLGMLYQANIYVAMKDSVKAESVLTQLLNDEKKDPLIRQIAYLTLATNQERTGRCEGAIHNYAEAEALQGPFKEDALLGEARCSAQTGDLKEALRSYRQYLTSFPGSDRAKDVALLSQEIEGKIGLPPEGKNN